MGDRAALNPLFWFVPGSPGSHVLSIVPLALLSSWAVVRFGWRGLVVPVMVVTYEEMQFQIVVLGVYHGGFTDLAILPFMPAALILYRAWFGRLPWLLFAAGYAVLLLDILDGFKISYGYPAGSPNLGDAYTNAKEIVSWFAVCAAMWRESRR